MGIEFSKGFNGEEDVCILVKPKDCITYCDWLEIARLMGWICSKEDLLISLEKTSEWEFAEPF